MGTSHKNPRKHRLDAAFSSPEGGKVQRGWSGDVDGGVQWDGEDLMGNGGGCGRIQEGIWGAVRCVEGCGDEGGAGMQGAVGGCKSMWGRVI